MIMRSDGIRRNRWIRMTAVLVTLSFAIVGSIVTYAANGSNSKEAESVVEHHINPLYSDKEILYYLFWTADKELKNDLINLQSELELTDEQISQLKDLGLKEHQAIQELFKQDISSEDFNAAASNVFAKRNDALKELLKEKSSTFEGWILSWWIKEKDRRTGSKSDSNDEINISEHEKISQSDYTRMLKIIQDVNAGKLPESALEEAQPLLEARPYYRTARSKGTPQSTEQTSEAPVSAVEAGGIETKDGKNLSIKLNGEATINFAELPFQKGEVFTLSVVSEEERALEIGIMSISTKQVYSDLVKSRTGSVNITVPEDGDYRIYISNKASDAANFELKLSKAIEGPIA